jgi:hypothetical protein
MTLYGGLIVNSTDAFFRTLLSNKSISIPINIRHWLQLPGLGNNNEKLGLPESVSAGIQFRFKNLFHGKISGNPNCIC